MNYELRIMNDELYVFFWGAWVIMNYELRIMNYELYVFFGGGVGNYEL